MAVLSKLKFVAVFGVAAVYASPAADSDDKDFDEMTDEHVSADDMGGMPGADGEMGDMPDMEAMFKLDTSCTAPEAPNGGKWVQKALTADNSQYVAHGCAASDMMSKMMGKDGDEKSKAEDCCVRRDVAMQMCGKSKASIEEDFEKCLAEKCEGDEECPFQAKMGPVMEQMMTGPDGACKGFTEAQGEKNCESVPAAEWDAKFEAYVKSFNDVHGTAYNAADATKGEEGDFVMNMILDNKEKTLRMEKKADPFEGMPGMDGMDGEGMGDSGDSPSGDDDEALSGSASDDEEVEEDKEGKEEL